MIVFRGFVLYQHHPAERTGPQRAYPIKLVERSIVLNTRKKTETFHYSQAWNIRKKNRSSVGRGSCLLVCMSLVVILYPTNCSLRMDENSPTHGLLFLSACSWIAITSSTAKEGTLPTILDSATSATLWYYISRMIVDFRLNFASIAENIFDVILYAVEMLQTLITRIKNVH